VTAGLKVHCGLDHGDGGKLWKAIFAGKAAIAFEPADIGGDQAAALLDAAMAFVEVVSDIYTGGWRVSEEAGVAALSKMSGRVNDTIAVTAKPDSAGDWKVTLEYAGLAVVSPRGQQFEAGVIYPFSYGHFEPRIDWTARFYAWTDSTNDPRKNADAFAGLTRSPPILTLRLPRLDIEGYRALPGLPRENFALEATGSVDLAPGEYTQRTISDDGVRVWVDGTLVIYDWKPHESAIDSAPLIGGHHDLRVQYYQGDGWYELRLEIIRARQALAAIPTGL